MSRIYRNIGFVGLWNGLPVRILMIGTLTAFQWLLYDTFKVSLGVSLLLHFQFFFLASRPESRSVNPSSLMHFFSLPLALFAVSSGCSSFLLPDDPFFQKIRKWIHYYSFFSYYHYF